MKQDTKTIAKLTRLKIVVDVVCQTDRAKFSIAAAKVAELEAQTAALRSQLTSSVVQLQVADQLAVSAKHRVWVERCLRALHLETSNAIVEREQVRAKLAISSGREEVIAKLLESAPKYPDG